MSECRNLAASAESFTLEAVRSNIFVSKGVKTVFRMPSVRHSEKGLQPFEILRANTSASNKAWLAPWPLNGLIGCAASPNNVTLPQVSER